MPRSSTVTLAFSLVSHVALLGDASSTIFSVLITPSGDSSLPTPEEYFTDMRLALRAEGEDSILNTDPYFDDRSYLGRVDRQQDFSNGAVILQVCDLDPLWEKGEIVYDLKDCPFSTVKLVVYSLVPAIAMSCGLLGFWSRQRNVRGRGKETQIAGLMALGLAVLSVSYDWFFGWTLFRSPRGAFQERVKQAGIGHLFAVVIFNFLVVHLYFRRRFLVGMPWYEYHKHGLALHLVFATMYLQPQSVVLFQSRLFDVDVFNIHFGTPSKMNEVLSVIGCISIFHDLPQLILQAAVFLRDDTGMQAPKVSRVSMVLSALSIGFAVNRQYIATVERQWYKEVVRMAGVRRLTTYGGASRWLKFQKRQSAAGDVRSHSSNQQQLFLAWMQSMGRRQDSIFQDAAATREAITAGEDVASLDSEDELDSLSEDSADKVEGDSPEGEGGEGRSGSDMASGSQNSETFSEKEKEKEKEKEGSGSGSEGSEGSEGSKKSKGSVQLQSYSRGGNRAAREESPLGRRRFSGRGRGGEVSSVVTESDIMAFAKHVAGRMSESGVATESMYDLDQASSVPGQNSLLRFAKEVARDEASSAPGGDMLAFARQVAKGAGSVSGVSDSQNGQSDLFAFARRAAQGASESGAPSESDILAFARAAAKGVSASGVGKSEVSSSAYSASGFGRSNVTGASDIFAIARKAARGVESEVGSQVTSEDDSVVSGATESDIFAFAQDCAEDVSQSGVGSAAPAPKRGPSSLAVPEGGRKRRGAPRAGADTSSHLESIAESDIFTAARRVAAEVSENGTVVSEGASAAGTMSSIFGAARRAAAAVSASGVGTESVAAGSLAGVLNKRKNKEQRQRRGRSMASSSAAEPFLPPEAREDGEMSDAESSIFGAARMAAEDVSEAGTGASSVFAAARRVAADVSASGVGTASMAGGGLGGFMAKRARPEDGERQRRGRRPVQATQSAESESEAESEDIMAAAQRYADETSSVMPSASGAGASSIFSAARRMAADVSVSGVGMSSVAGAGGGLGNFMSKRARPGEERDRQRRGRPVAKAAAAPSEGSEAESEDIFAAAQRYADETSHVGMSESGTGASSIFAAARRVADGVSASGVGTASLAGGGLMIGPGGLLAPKRTRPRPEDGEDRVRQRRGRPEPKPAAVAKAAPPQEFSSGGESEDVLAVARRAAEGTSQVGASESGTEASSIFAMARGVAADVSVSGIGSSVASAAMLARPKRKPLPTGDEQRRRRARPQNAGGPSVLDDDDSDDGLGDVFTRGTACPPDDRSEVDSDLFAMARGIADGVSRSGVQSSVPGDSMPAGLADLFASTRRGPPPKAAPKAGKRPVQRTRSEISGASSGASMDFFALARGAADEVSRSGVQSSAAASAVPAAMQDLFSSTRKRPVSAPPRDDVESDASSDIFAAARGAADELSRSGVTSAAASAAAGQGVADLFSKAKKGPQSSWGKSTKAQEPAAQSSSWGKKMESSQSKNLGDGSEQRSSWGQKASRTQEMAAQGSSWAQKTAMGQPQDLAGGDASAGESEVSGDLFDVAMGVAEGLSTSGVQSSVATGHVEATLGDLFTRAQQPAAQDAEDDDFGGSESDGESLFAIAQGAAEGASQSGASASVAGSHAGGGLAGLFTDVRRGAAAASEEQASVASSQSLFAAARGAAEATSAVESASVAGHAAQGGLGDLFSGRRQGTARSGSNLRQGGGAPTRSVSNLLGSARRAADDASQSGDGSDILGSARRAADEFSQSGDESDIFDAARQAADDLSQSGAASQATSGSDILGAARRAAEELSQSSAGAPKGRQAASSFGVTRGKAKAAPARPRDREFQPPPRRFAADSRHANAPPLPSAVKHEQASAPPPPPAAAVMVDTRLWPRFMPRPQRRQVPPAPPDVAAPPLPGDLEILARQKQAAAHVPEPPRVPPPMTRPPLGPPPHRSAVETRPLPLPFRRLQGGNSSSSTAPPPPPLPPPGEHSGMQRSAEPSSSPSPLPRGQQQESGAGRALQPTFSAEVAAPPHASRTGRGEGSTPVPPPARSQPRVAVPAGLPRLAVAPPVEHGTSSMLQFAREASPLPNSGKGMGRGDPDSSSPADICFRRPTTAAPTGADDAGGSPGQTASVSSGDLAPAGGTYSPVSPTSPLTTLTYSELGSHTRERLRRRPLQDRAYKRKSTRSVATLPSAPSDAVEEGELLPSSDGEAAVGAVPRRTNRLERQGSEEGEVMQDEDEGWESPPEGEGLQFMRGLHHR